MVSQSKIGNLKLVLSECEGSERMTLSARASTLGSQADLLRGLEIND
jgi:hypothetical protein